LTPQVNKLCIQRNNTHTFFQLFVDRYVFTTMWYYLQLLLFKTSNCLRLRVYIFLVFSFLNNTFSGFSKTFIVSKFKVFIKTSFRTKCNRIFWLAHRATYLLIKGHYLLSNILTIISLTYVIIVYFFMSFMNRGS